MRCVSSESPPSSNILVLVRAMVLPFRSSGIDDKQRVCDAASSMNAHEAKRRQALAGIRDASWSITAFRHRSRQSNSFQVLDQILLVGIAEL